MKNLFIATVLSVFLFSCGDRGDYINDRNSASVLTIIDGAGKNVTEIEDSVKISLKSNKPYFDLNLSLNDVNDNIKDLSFSIKQGAGALKQNQVTLSSSIDFSTSKVMTLQYYPETTGTHIIDVIAIDEVGATNKVSIILNVIDNLPPFAKLADRLEDLEVKSPYEKYIDASGSYDPDQNIGGGISNYKFTINGQTFETSNNKPKWIFPGRGNYIVTVECEDSDGVWSTPATETYSIQ